MIYLDHLLEATGGVLLYPGKAHVFSTFSHDSRQLAPGELFVAVRGARGNGHDYLLDALRRGAAGLLVEGRAFNGLSEKVQSELAAGAIAVVAVEDTRVALQRYAAAILERWHPTVIVVTGSVGKTGTKEAIACVLGSSFATFRSWQNYNDLLGIPLSLGRLEPQHAYAVLELGCDHPGEIADLCRIVRPQIGVLTNVSPAQLQYFGSMERLAQELGMLLPHLPADGCCFFQQADPAILKLLQGRSYSASTLPFAPTSPSGKIPQITHMDWNGLRGSLPGESNQEVTLGSHLIGTHHFQVMLAAYQVALYCGMPVAEIQRALLQVAPLAGRLHPLPGIHQSRLLDDTHNAVPASMLAGLATLASITPRDGRRIAVLGDMLNLGSYEEEAHRLVGHEVARSADYLITRGERAALIAETARRAGMRSEQIVVTSTHEDTTQAVRYLLQQRGEQSQVHSTEREAVLYDVVLIKGSEEMRMERVTEMLMVRAWEAPEKLVRQTPGWKKTVFRHAERPTWIEVDLNAIGTNTRHIKALVGSRVQVLVSLKADAYGHGAVRVARTALHNGASRLGVATVSEATPLREAGITAPILVFGYIPSWQMREAVRLDVIATLYSLESAQELSQAALALEKTVPVHVKIDSGMGRLGIRAEQIDEVVALVREIQRLPNLEIEGIYTHFAAADAGEKTHSRLQLARFQKVLAALDVLGLRPLLVHAANSAATLNLPETHFDMVRPGIAIYGLHPSGEVHLPEGFRAALSFKTQVSQVKMIPAGECLSYGCTYITERQTRIAVLPVGYADGFRRSPHNWGSVLIHSREAPVLGRVCMDQCMVDVTDIPETRMGDEVVLIGRQGEAELTAEQIAHRLGTINYEVVSEILARVPRVD